MHKAEAGPAHQERAYDFVECPMKAAAAGVKDDIDPANMVTGSVSRIQNCHHFQNEEMNIFASAHEEVV